MNDKNYRVLGFRGIGVYGFLGVYIGFRAILLTGNPEEKVLLIY